MSRNKFPVSEATFLAALMRIARQYNVGVTQMIDVVRLYQKKQLLIDWFALDKILGLDRIQEYKARSLDHFLNKVVPNTLTQPAIGILEKIKPIISQVVKDKEYLFNIMSSKKWCCEAIHATMNSLQEHGYDLTNYNMMYHKVRFQMNQVVAKLENKQECQIQFNKEKQLQLTSNSQSSQPVEIFSQHQSRIDEIMIGEAGICAFTFDVL